MATAREHLDPDREWTDEMRTRWENGELKSDVPSLKKELAKEKRRLKRR